MPIALAVVAGALLSLLGALLLIPLPEVGLPLLLGGLRLLGRRYAWARALNRRVDRAAAAVMTRFHRLPVLARAGVVVLLAVVAVALVYLAVRHVL